MSWPGESDYFYDEKLSQNEIYHLVSREAVHLERKDAKKGDAQINRTIVRLLWNVHLAGMPPPSALITLIQAVLGTNKRARSLPRSIGKKQAAMFLAENPNASNRAVARGANAKLEEIKRFYGKETTAHNPLKEWIDKPLPKLSDHSVKKWRTEPEFQQLVSEDRRKVSEDRRSLKAAPYRKGRGRKKKA